MNKDKTPLPQMNKDKTPSPAAKLAEKLKPHLAQHGYGASQAIDAFNTRIPEFVLCTVLDSHRGIYREGGGTNRLRRAAWLPRAEAAVKTIRKIAVAKRVHIDGSHIYVFP